jgi:hypothetical protein
MFTIGATGTVNVDQYKNGIITSPNYPNMAGTVDTKISLVSSYSYKTIRIYITDLDTEDFHEYIEKKTNNLKKESIIKKNEFKL